MSYNRIAKTSCFAILFASVVGVLSPHPADGQLAPQTVILSAGFSQDKTPAPDLPGLVLGPIFIFSMNQSSEVTFSTYSLGLTGPGVDSSNNNAIFAGTANNFHLINRAGEAATNLPAGTVYGQPLNSEIDTSGHVTFLDFVTGGPFGSSPSSSGALFMQSGAGQIANPVAYTGQNAPGAPAGATLNLPGQTYTVNSNGQIVFMSYLLGGGFDGTGPSQAIYYHPGISNPAATPQVVAIPKGPAPDTGDTFLSLGSPVINSLGTTAFSGHLASAGADADSGIWLGQPGNVHLAVREGDQSPIAGVNFGEISPPYINDSGQIGFSALLTGAGVDATNNSAFFVGTPGNFKLAVRTGTQAADLPAGVNYGQPIQRQAMGPGGKVLFTNMLSGVNVTTDNDSAVFAGLPGDIHLIVREGDPVPGVPNAKFSGVMVYGGMNRKGQIEFMARFALNGSTQTFDSIWATTPDNQLVEVAAHGQIIDVGNGVLKTIYSLDMGTTFPELGGMVSFADDGQLLYHATFTDESEGLFMVMVPEPQVVWLLPVAAVVLHRRRRKGHYDYAKT